MTRFFVILAVSALVMLGFVGALAWLFSWKTAAIVMSIFPALVFAVFDDMQNNSQDAWE